ncbi:rpo operon protein [Halarchaeum sp. CBA1220]|uniref:KEOPS complex subunit Pcc1 n=1 Tax=Halarchaeum sp. CBA1220 TaxID=1853682 RepID=UPI000F3A8B03|nr:KEOPS complex subunit Pcc1 [Halarchaeum sp. CBA1220]QLC33733.1 rpo operon protein [Halarchaeum sp. CBA1220]
MSHRTSLVFSYDTPRVAAAVYSAVRVEASDIEGDRTDAAVERDGDTVRVTVEGADLTALRAGVNTWTTLVGVAESTYETGRRTANQHS